MDSVENLLNGCIRWRIYKDSKDKTACDLGHIVGDNPCKKIISDSSLLFIVCRLTLSDKNVNVCLQDPTQFIKTRIVLF